MKIISQSEFDTLNVTQRTQQKFNGIISYYSNSDDDTKGKQVHRFINSNRAGSDVFIVSDADADVAYFWLCDQIKQTDNVSKISEVIWIVDAFEGFEEDLDDLEDD